MTSAPEPLGSGTTAGTGGRRRDEDVPPMLPSRTAYLLMFGAAVLAGALGGTIGFGIADIMFESGIANVLGAVVGAAIAATGVAIVGVLVLRAMSEWRRASARLAASITPRASSGSGPGPGPGPGPEGGITEIGPDRDVTAPG